MPTNYKKLIQVAVKDQREVLGLSQAEFAKELSHGLPKPIQKQVVSHWETGRKIPSIWMMAAIRECWLEGLDWQHRLADLIIDALLQMESENGTGTRTQVED